MKDRRDALADISSILSSIPGPRIALNLWCILEFELDSHLFERSARLFFRRAPLRRARSTRVLPPPVGSMNAANAATVGFSKRTVSPRSTPTRTLLDNANLAPSAAVELLRGRLALGLGLADIAEERLTQARQLARSVGDVESEAAALVMWGSASETTDKKEERLREALGLYEKLGDATQAEDVRRRLYAISVR